jgi:hypothetical protein
VPRKLGRVVLRSVTLGAAGLALVYLVLVLPRDVRRAGEYDKRCTSAMMAGRSFIDQSLADHDALPGESDFRRWADSEGLRMLSLHVDANGSYDLMFWRGEEGTFLHGRDPAVACESWSKQSIALHWLVGGAIVLLGVFMAVRWIKEWG